MSKLHFIKKISFLVFFLVIKPTFSQKTIIKSGSEWSYYDKGYLKNNWYKDTKILDWQTGNTPIGYGDSKIATEIKYGSDSKNKDHVKYFKKNITISKNKLVAFEFKFQRDDGIVIYVNGKELLRNNMPNTTINSNSLALSTIEGYEENIFHSKVFSTDIFKEGVNTIGVSIYQCDPESSDCIFDLELIAHNNPEILSTIIKNNQHKNKNFEVKLSQLNSKFEIEKINLKKEDLENSNYILKIIISILGFILLINLLGCIYFINNYKKKHKKSEKKVQQLNTTIINKEKELITLTTNLLHNKQYFKEIKADIKGLTTNEKTIKREILNQIDFVLERDEEWENLKNHFNAVYTGFYDKILALHPTITETELRHCMFIKLHMQTKEIAKVLLIDPRSVQTARYRIKKKMNLNENEDLRDYLLKIT